MVSIRTGLLACALVLGLGFEAGAAEDFSDAALARVNALRAGKGAAPLSVSDKLVRAAAAHANDMARRNFFSHKGSNGRSLGDRVRKQGYRFCFVAENIAMGQRNIDQALASWMKSKPHRKNLLSRKAEQFGLAWSEGNRWVMVLGTDGC